MARPGATPARRCRPARHDDLGDTERRLAAELADDGGLGFCLGKGAQMTWLEPGLATTLRPGVRPRTTLTPSLALRDGQPWLAFGTPGGDQDDQWSLLFSLSLMHIDVDLQAAIDAPTLHSTHVPIYFWARAAEPGGLVVEDRIDSGVIAELRRRGPRGQVVDGWSLGQLSAAGVESLTGSLRAAAANSRGAQGYAVGR